MLAMQCRLDGCGLALRSAWCVIQLESNIWLTNTHRQAQDLVLHRAEAVKSDIQLRRRLWAACVITDRWYVVHSIHTERRAEIISRYGLTLGLPFMIDVHDCDARLPGPELPTTQSHFTPVEVQQAISLLFMGEFVKLSVLLGKVIKTIYR